MGITFLYTTLVSCSLCTLYCFIQHFPAATRGNLEEICAKLPLKVLNKQQIDSWNTSLILPNYHINLKKRILEAVGSIYVQEFGHLRKNIEQAKFKHSQSGFSRNIFN